MINIEKFAEELVSLNVTELQQLKKVLKDKYGLEEPVATIVAAAPVEEVKVEEKTTFKVILKKVSLETPKKMNTIRALKEILAVDLKTAKENSEAVPFIVAENVSKIQAETIADKLRELDAEIEIL